MHKDIGVFIPKGYKENVQNYTDNIMEIHEEEWENYTVGDVLEVDDDFTLPDEMDVLVDGFGWVMKEDDYSFNQLIKNRMKTDDIVKVNIHYTPNEQGE